MLSNAPDPPRNFGWDPDHDIREFSLRLLSNLHPKFLATTLSRGKDGQILEDKLQLEVCKQSEYLLNRQATVSPGVCKARPPS